MKKTCALVRRIAVLALLPAAAEAQTRGGESVDDIIVTGVLQRTTAGTKTDTPLLETPQPITVINEDTYIAQGSVSVADAFRYVSGVQANVYGTDGRVDSVRVRGTSPLQFRDGMRDIYDVYASIRADPYNFSRIEVVRGPASVLFGQSSIGGIFNLVSKAPEFAVRADAALVYGSFDRREALADLTGPLTGTIAARIVGRVRDADTQVNFVADDRIMLAPSLRWRPSAGTDLTLLGLYQEDDGGSQSTFLPLFGTLFDSPAGKLPNDTFPGTPGWDRYDGRLLQGTALLEQALTDRITLNLRARYIDSDVDYRTQYANPFLNPRNPYVANSGGRRIARTGSATLAELNIFSTDNNIQARFSTGSAIEHLLLGGVDYSEQRVRRQQQTIIPDIIDLYDPDYAALPPAPRLNTATFPRTGQDLLGFYAQDQIRFWDRVSLVLGIRHDRVTTRVFNRAEVKDTSTTVRAGVIGELGWGVSPFFSYTESFLPITGLDPFNNPFVPQTGRQLEAGVKWAPDRATLVTLTGFDIKDRNRPIVNPNPDPTAPNPNAQVQAGEVISKGVELEASRVLPDDFELRVNYSYTDSANANGTPVDNLADHVASAWLGKTIKAPNGWTLRLGTGVRYVSESLSFGRVWLGSPQAPDGFIRTPEVMLVDALAEVRRGPWSLSINANNLFGEKFYAACLARGDCFVGAERTVFGTLRYRFEGL